MKVFKVSEGFLYVKNENGLKKGSYANFNG